MPPNTPNVTPFYLDKALWVAFLAPVLLILNQKFGITLDASVIVGLILPIASYVVMHKWKTATLAAADKAAVAAVAAVKDEDPAVGLAAAPK